MVPHSYDFFKKILGVRSRHAIVTASGYLHKFAFQGGASMSIVNYLGLHSGDPPFEVRDNFLIPELDFGASGHSRIHNFAFQGEGAINYCHQLLPCLVYRCTGVPMYCVPVDLYQYAGIPVYQDIGVPVCRCTSVPVCCCTRVPVSWYTSVPVYQCIGVPVSLCTSMPMFGCTCALVRRCTNVSVYLSRA